MKRIVLIGLVAAALAAAQTPQELYQKALVKERSDGKLDEAIQLYRRAAEAAGKDRALAAKALVQLGACYEKLGNTESRKVYERVLRDFADQKDAVTIARARLGARGGDDAIVAASRRVWIAPPRADFYAKISHDGRYIPYTNWSENGDLFLHDLATGADRRVTDTAGTKPGGSGEYAEEAAFSRDNLHLAYTWARKEGVELRVIGLQTAGVPKPRHLFATEEVKWITPHDWSPDGQSIAVHLQRKDRSAQIGLVSVQDGSLRVLKSVDWRGPTGILFSPDGKYLAYDLPAADDPTGQHDVFILASDGSREIAAAVHPSNDSVIGWSPDGKRLLFSSDRSGSKSLWALPFGEGQPQAAPQLVRRDIGESDNLGMTASGALYSAVYDPGGVPPDIQFAAFDFAAGKFLSPRTSVANGVLGTALFAGWSPDGKHLAYAAMRKTHVAIGIRSVDTGQIRELVPSPNFDPSLGYFHSIHWAPDGKSFIAAARGDKHGTGIFRIDAQTGRTSLIVNGAKPRTAVLSPDGNTLYYRSEAPNNKGIVIMKRDLSSGEERELIRRKFMLGGVNLSPDGRYIAILTSNESSFNPVALELIPASGGEARELIRRPNLAAWVNFSPDGHYIATNTPDPATKSRMLLLIPVEGGEPREWMRRGAGVAMWAPDSRSALLKSGTEVWRALLDGSEPRKLDLNADRIAGGFVGSPDGKHVAFWTPGSTKKAPTEVWVLENFLSNLDARK